MSNIILTSGWPAQSTHFSLISELSDDNRCGCRICHGSADEEELFSYCQCKGSVGLAHSSCLLLWIKKSSSVTCEICKENYNIITQRNKIIWKWKLPSVSKKGYVKLFFLMAFLSLFLTFTTWAVSSAINSQDLEVDKTDKFKLVSYLVCDTFLLIPIVGICGLNFRLFVKYMSKCIIMNQTIAVIPKGKYCEHSSGFTKDKKNPDSKPKEDIENQAELRVVSCNCDLKTSTGDSRKQEKTHVKCDLNCFISLGENFTAADIVMV